MLDALREQYDKKLLRASCTLPASEYIEPKVKREECRLVAETPEVSGKRGRDMRKGESKKAANQTRQRRRSSLRRAAGAGPSFVVSDDATSGPEDASKAFQRFFDSSKNVALLSGRAGSGKTVLLRSVELYAIGAYRAEKAKAGITVVVLSVKLSDLRNPVDGVFEEACKQLGLRQHQTDELREKIQAPDSKIEMVLILDSYDKLPVTTLFKNLYRTNNLDQFRNDASGLETTTLSQPKVIFACRQELLNTNPGYATAFLPIESQSTEKGDASKALEYFQELRICDFNEKRSAYFKMSAALLWRVKFSTFHKSFSRMLHKPFRRPQAVGAEAGEEEKGEAQFISATFGDGTFSDADLDQLEQVFLASTLPPLQIKSDETKEKKRPVSYPLMDVERSSTDTRNWFERLR